MTSSEIKAAQSKLNDLVLGRAGVEGTAIGLSDGDACLKVYVSTDRGSRGIPSKVAGFPVVVEKTGRFGKL